MKRNLELVLHFSLQYFTNNYKFNFTLEMTKVSQFFKCVNYIIKKIETP